jgi:hypothetical protein
MSRLSTFCAFQGRIPPLPHSTLIFTLHLLVFATMVVSFISVFAMLTPFTGLHRWDMKRISMEDRERHSRAVSLFDTLSNYTNKGRIFLKDDRALSAVQECAQALWEQQKERRNDTENSSSSIEANDGNEEAGATAPSMDEKKAEAGTSIGSRRLLNNDEERSESSKGETQKINDRRIAKDQSDTIAVGPRSHDQKQGTSTTTFSSAGLTPSPMFCIVMCTAHRKSNELEHDYLTQTIGSLVADLRLEDVPQTVVLVHNTGVKNRSNTAGIARLRGIVPVITWEEDDWPRDRYGSDFDWARGQQSMDYANSLRHCACTGAKYTVVLEDDVVPTRGYWHKLRRRVAELDAKDPSWALMKLFETSEYSGWEIDDTFFIILFSCVFGALLTIPVAIIHRFRALRSKYSLGAGSAHHVDMDTNTDMACTGQNHNTCSSKRDDFSHTNVITWRLTRQEQLEVLIFFIICSISTAVSVISIGKIHFFGSPRGVVPTKLGCCSPAHVYKTSDALDLSEYLLENRIKDATDVVIFWWAERNRRLQYTLHPNLFQHIGSWSTREDGNKGTGMRLHRSATWEPER